MFHIASVWNNKTASRIVPRMPLTRIIENTCDIVGHSWTLHEITNRTSLQNVFFEIKVKKYYRSEYINYVCIIYIIINKLCK